MLSSSIRHISPRALFAPAISDQLFSPSAIFSYWDLLCALQSTVLQLRNFQRVSSIQSHRHGCANLTAFICSFVTLSVLCNSEQIQVVSEFPIFPTSSPRTHASVFSKCSLPQLASVPLMSLQSLYVPTSMPKCIANLNPNRLQHVCFACGQLSLILTKLEFTIGLEIRNTLSTNFTRRRVDVCNVVIPPIGTSLGILIPLELLGLFELSGSSYSTFFFDVRFVHNLFFPSRQGSLGTSNLTLFACCSGMPADAGAEPVECRFLFPSARAEPLLSPC